MTIITRESEEWAVGTVPKYWKYCKFLYLGLDKVKTKEEEEQEEQGIIVGTVSRGVAQPGSAPALGAGGRAFKSPRPDQIVADSKIVI